MTKEEMIELARQAGVRDDEHTFEFSQYKYLERFAVLVAQHERDAFTAHAMTSAEKAIDVAIKLEREMCAKEAERTFYSVQAAENIRARGKND